MKKNVLVLIVTFLMAFSIINAQNRRFLTTTSIGFFKPATTIDGIVSSGFTTVTGVELLIGKHLYFTGSLDFQSISYAQKFRSIDIDGQLGMTPVLLGGRYLVNNKSKFAPYVGVSGGITVLNIPKFETLDTKLRVFSERKLPLTYALRGGVEFRLNESFFPYLEVGFQSLKDAYFKQKLNFAFLNIGVRTYPF